MKKFFLLYVMILSAFVSLYAQTGVPVSEGDSTAGGQTVTVTLVAFGEQLAQMPVPAGEPIYAQNLLGYAMRYNPNLDYEKFDFMYEGMPHFAFPFLGWSESNMYYSPFEEGSILSSDITLYAAFNAYGESLEPEYSYEWSAKPVSSYVDLLTNMNSGGLQTYVVAAEENGVLYFPAAPEERTYETVTSDSLPANTTIYVVSDQVAASRVATGMSEDGSLSGVDISRIAVFNFEPHYSGEATQVGLPTGDSIYLPTGFHLQDFNNKGLFMPTLSEDGMRYQLVSTTEGYDFFDESLLWQVAMNDNVPMLTFNGMQIPLTLVYAPQAPYFFAASTMDATGAPVTEYDPTKLRLYRLTESEVKNTTEPRIFAVFDYNTVNISMNQNDLQHGMFEPDVDWMDMMMQSDSTYSDIPGFTWGDVVEDSTATGLDGAPETTSIDLFLLEGYAMQVRVVYEEPDKYRVHWFSSDSAYNDIYTNPLLIRPTEDMMLQMVIEPYTPVIIIAGDTIKLSADTTKVINLTEDGSITYDLTTNTITLDSAAVTGTGISSDQPEFTLAVENNSTIAVDEEYGIKFDGESLTLQTADSVMLTVQAPQPLVGNGGNLYIEGNFIFSSVEFRLTAGQAAAHRSKIRRMPSDATPLVHPAVSGFANVELADGIELQEVYYTDEAGNTVPGDPTKTHYHAAEAAYGEVDVDTQSFTPATSLVFADSNFYTDYIDGKIVIVSGVENTTNNDAIRVSKVVENGNVLIIRGNTTYNVLGTVVR